MQRIVIDLYDHTSEDEVTEITEALKGLGVGGVRHERVTEERVAPFTALQKRVREGVWFAQKVGSDLSLTAEEADALWQSILSDAIAARAFTGPRT
jgi:hypothetical protein